MHIDIPSDKLLPEFEKGIKEYMSKIMTGETKKVVVDKVEWTAEGIRLWIQTEK